MSTDQYKIVPYQPSYHESVLMLLAHLCCPDQEQNQKYFAWKYDSNPYNRPPVIFLALKDKQVVGVRSFFPMNWQFGSDGKRIACLQDADTVIHPDHRRFLTEAGFRTPEEAQPDQVKAYDPVYL